MPSRVRKWLGVPDGVHQWWRIGRHHCGHAHGHLKSCFAPRTQVYFERRVKEGMTKHEVIRILKRYVAREVYRYLPRG